MKTKLLAFAAYAVVALCNLFWFPDLFMPGTIPMDSEYRWYIAIGAVIAAVSVTYFLFRIMNDVPFSRHQPIWFATMMCSLPLFIIPFMYTSTFGHSWDQWPAFGSILGTGIYLVFLLVTTKSAIKLNERQSYWAF